MKKTALNILLTLALTIVYVGAFGQVCNNCTQTITNGNATFIINNGETYCIPEGVYFTGNITINAGGTLCIANGGSVIGGTMTLKAGGFINIALGGTLATPWSINEFNGTVTNYGSFVTSFWSGNYATRIINYGTFNPNGFNAAFTGVIENHGTFSPGQIQNFAGTLINYNIVNLPQSSFNSGSIITNHGKITSTGQSIFHSSTITNYDSLIFNGTLEIKGDANSYVENKANAYFSANAYNTAFETNADNYGYLFLKNPNSGNGINGVIYNGGLFVTDGETRIESNTSMVNDSLMLFKNSGTSTGINYKGPFLTNNGVIRILNGGSLSFNGAGAQISNNGLIVVSGAMSHNVNSTLLTNTCRIVCNGYTAHSGTTDNKGLIWSVQANGTPADVTINTAVFKNDSTAQVRGKDFTNNGTVSGCGAFYFTGNTVNNGFFTGSTTSNKIRFYDIGNPNNIFDTPYGTITNVIRPATMTLKDTTGINAFDCGSIPPVTAGNAPQTDTVLRSFCPTPNNNLSIDLNAYVEPYNNNFSINWNSIQLFEYNNPNNTSNGASTLHIADKGTFTANTATGNITFSPDPNFVAGEVIIQYKINNTCSSCTPSTVQSNKTKITITVSCNNDYTPAVSVIDTSFCGADGVLLNMSNYISAHAPAGGYSFSLQWNTLKLFDPANPNNPGNGSNTIQIPNTGTFTITQTNPGQITFFPESGFTGTATAQYQITNIWNKNNETFTSDKTAINAHGSNIPAPHIETPHTF